MFRHSPEVPIVDFPMVEVVDLEVVVVIRFVAMETIPETMLARDGGPRKRKSSKKRSAPESLPSRRQPQPLYARTVSPGKTVPHVNLSSRDNRPYVGSIAWQTGSAVIGPLKIARKTSLPSGKKAR